LDDAGITFGSIARLEDVVADPQAAANDLFVEAVTADGKTVRTVTSPFEIAGIAKTAAGPAPEIGEHTDEVLTAAGVTAEALADLRRRAVIG
jgi:crotonobetainyl-CoA:carnitine CoA-transferase CaiB-like acyl-CoA transferase